jgi:aryl-alcohol dehydrogenase-like predicted oxidoreductase
MKLRYLLYCLPLWLLLTACPYSSEVPLKAPDEKVNNTLLGKWIEESSSDNPTFFVITKTGEKTYQFEQNDYNSSDEVYTQKYFEAHLTKIGSVNFLNLKEPDDEGGKYYFFKLDKNDDGKSFVLYEVTDNIDETFDNSAAMYAFFDKHKDLSFFYNKDEKTYNKE